MNNKIIYYWFHNNMPREDRDNIQKAFDNKDFKTFIKYYKKYTAKGILDGKYVYTDEGECVFMPIEYFPYSILRPSDYRVFCILNEEDFKEITYFEYGCG